MGCPRTTMASLGVRQYNTCANTRSYSATLSRCVTANSTRGVEPACGGGSIWQCSQPISSRADCPLPLVSQLSGYDGTHRNLGRRRGGDARRRVRVQSQDRSCMASTRITETRLLRMRRTWRRPPSTLHTTAGTKLESFRDCTSDLLNEREAAHNSLQLTESKITAHGGVGRGGRSRPRLSPRGKMAPVGP